MITSTPTKSAGESLLPALSFAVGEARVAPSRAAISSRHDVCVEISSTSDLVLARQRGRLLALRLGFPGQDISVIAAAVSEVARNIVEHAEVGEIIFSVVRTPGRTGLQIVAHDEGPGIFDANRIAVYGHGAAAEPGIGLPGVRLLMDEFEIASTVGRGTTVTMTKWLR